MYSNILKVFVLFILPLFNIVADNDEKKILLGKIDDNIDPRTNRYSKLLLDEASKDEYDIVVIEMDTYGGAVNDADDIRTRILDFEKPIYVWINKDAASAGALISIACDSIYMSSGASIGAATVVTGDGAQAPDKYQSYMRSIMRSTAEAKGRDPKIAEAMVDEDISVDSISMEGKVITFSTKEAMKFGFCDAELNSVEEILERQGIEKFDIVPFELGSAEGIISFFLNPIVSSILILLILGGLYFELQTPGIGFPIIASITALILYLVPYYLNGVAENWEIILFFVGVILIVIEVQGFDLSINDWEEMFNAFSPNGDGINDSFSFEENHAISEFSVKIFNRWGSLVYSWTDPNFKWNGLNFDGDNLIQGVYYYYMNAIGQDGQLYEKKGSISLFF